MAYVPNPADPTHPTTQDLAGNMAYEFQALKGYLQSLISSGTNFYNLGTFRNRLKNGAFNIFNRFGPITCAAGTATYTIDQWRVKPTGGTVSANQVFGAPNKSNWALALTPNTGTTSFLLASFVMASFSQDMVVGSSVTVSGIYNPNGTGVLPSVALYTPPGGPNSWNSGASVTGASQVINVQNPEFITVPGSWIYFSNTFTLSQDSTYGLKLEFSFTGPTVGTVISLNNIQLEKSLYTTPFEVRPVQVDQFLCYEQFIIGLGVISGYAGAGGQLINVNCPYPTPMSMAAGIINVTITGGVNCPNLANVAEQSYQQMLFDVAATAAGYVGFNYSYNVSAEILTA